jgi:glycosyltransferase involved in cell wall biosynthesis
VEATDNVSVESAPKLLLRWQRWKGFDGMVVRAHASRLRRRVGPSQAPLIALMFHPSYAPYARYLKADAIVYHAYDLFEATPGWTEEMNRLEIALLRQANLVTTVTESIAARLRRKVRREIKLLPNGVDFQAFRAAATAAVPADLARIGRPRLGYVGSLHPYVNYGLVARLAEARPAWNFVFIGGAAGAPNDRAARELALCRTRGNVHFLGEKHRVDVPAYVSHMDVNLMLYRIDAGIWTNSGHPLKLHEYMAAGKPIVSADLAAVREFSPWVRIANSFHDWLVAIDEVLAAGRGMHERIAIARQHSWDAKVAQLDGWIQQVVPRPAASACPANHSTS